MKIYTKTGDSGETSLYGGKRITKSSPRILAIGEIDELNALLGVISNKLSFVNIPDVTKVILRIQNELFELGSDMATPLSANQKLKILRISDEQIKNLEDDIDRLEKKLTPIKNFILPGGSEVGSLIHHARTVCRRAERSVVYVNSIEKINSNDLIYLNRLSDLFFVIARYVNKTLGIVETPWIINK